MERKGSWFSSVKKALSPDSKRKKAKKTGKSKKWFGKEKPSVSESPIPDNPEPHLPPVEDVNLDEGSNQHAEHVNVTAVEVVQPPKVNQFAGKSKEEVAAIKIQTAFRGYLARRALRALKGLVRLKSVVDGPIANRQTANTLKCMQTLSRVQSQVHSRRLRMLEENRALQRQLLMKHAKELETLRMGEEWDDGLQSKEQIEASLQHKYEAATRRERALAYSYTHQQTRKKSSKTTNLLFMDTTNPQWGWSWLERWMSADKDPNGDQSSMKSSTAGEISKSFARQQLNSDNPSPSKITSSTRTPRKLKPPSPRGSAISQEDDSRSMTSVLSERNRRHTIGGSSVRDDDSLSSTASMPSYMVPTQAAKAKSRLSSPFGVENSNNHNSNNNNTPDKGSAGVAKKRLSFPPSPARPRRHSGPPKVNTISDNVDGMIS